MPDRLTFYALVQKLVTQLVGARGAGIEAVVDNCLRWIGEYFEVDRVALGGISTQGKLTPSLRVWGQGQPLLGSLEIAPTPGPEMVAHWRREGSLIYSRLEDLHALPQFREHTRCFGIQAGVFWLHRDLGTHADGMAISSVNPRGWPEDIENLADMELCGRVSLETFLRTN